MSYLAEAENVTKHFPLSHSKEALRAVDGVSLSIRPFETLGLAGESGCGKTTLARMILGLTRPTTGTVRFMGHDLSKLDSRATHKVRREMQIVFQDPTGSLNPRKTISGILSQPLRVHKIVEKRQLESEVMTMLEMVGLTPPESFSDRFPHELSGGQKQRVAIARALSLKPKLIVADEPVSSLDLSIRAQILNLMKDLQKSFGLTYLFISHDLAVLRSLCTRVAIMYLGRIVELASTDELFTRPFHPYTKALLAATPVPNPRTARSRKSIVLSGDVPSLAEIPPGCRFHTRCPVKQYDCAQIEPRLIEVAGEHFVACPPSLRNFRAVPAAD